MKKILALASIFILFNGPNVFAKAKRISLEQIIEIKRVGTMKVSPNGKYIAYTKIVPRKLYKDDDGKAYVELHLVDQQGHSRRFITGKQRIGFIRWGPHSQFVYFLSQRNKDLFASLYKIAIDGGEAEKVIETESDILSYSINYDATKLTYLAKEKQDKIDLELEKKGFKAIVYEESLKNTHAYLADLTDRSKAHKRLAIDAHLLSIQYHPKRNYLLIKTSPTALIDDHYVASQYRIYQQDGDLVLKIKTQGKLSVAQWSPDGNYIALIGSEDINDPAAGRLLIINSHSGKITRPIAGYNGQIKALQWLSNTQFSGSQPGFQQPSKSRYQLAYLGHIGTQSEVSIINLDDGSITKKFEASNEVINYIHADWSGKFLAGIASSDKHPKEIINLSGDKITRLTNTNPWLSQIEMPKQKTIRYQARDGLDLQGVVIYPNGYRKNTRYPLIMMVHGGPESHITDGWLDRYTYPIKYAAARGFVVFLPNYRGSTGRGIEFSKKSQGDYAGSEFNDLVDAISHLSKIGLVDKKRVGITGASYGGYASAWAATALSEHFAASVMLVGVTDQISKFGTTDIAKEIYNVHARSYPWEKWLWMLHRSPIYHTDKAKTPLLIMHGDSDTRVHPSQSMELYRYIKTRTDTPVRLVFYPGEGHGNEKTAAQLDYAIRLMRWMEFYLKGRAKGKTKPNYQIRKL